MVSTMDIVAAQHLCHHMGSEEIADNMWMMVGSAAMVVVAVSGVAMSVPLVRGVVALWPEKCVHWKGSADDGWIAQ